MDEKLELPGQIITDWNLAISGEVSYITTALGSRTHE